MLGGYGTGYGDSQKRGQRAAPDTRFSLCTWEKEWLGRRDSNPTYLIQSQAFYR